MYHRVFRGPDFNGFVAVKFDRKFTIVKLTSLVNRCSKDLWQRF